MKKQLLEQLQLKAGGSFFVGVNDVHQIKYTRLVVEECIKIIEDYCDNSPEIYGLPLDILEHFGFDD